MLGRRLAALLLAAVLLTSSCDLDWRERAARHAVQGGNSLAAGDLAGAEKSFRAALVSDPYSREAIFGLARVMALRPGQEEAAIKCYARCRRLGLPPELESYAKEQIELLSRIRDGDSEDPAQALDELWQATCSNQEKQLWQCLDASAAIYALRLGGSVFRLAREWEFPNGVNPPATSWRSVGRNSALVVADSGDGKLMAYRFVREGNQPWLLASVAPKRWN